MILIKPKQRLYIPCFTIISKKSASSGGGGEFTGILDSISNVAAAYSLRKLKSSYSGYAIRVRRSSDSTEQDIGFASDGEFDSSAFSSFVGGATGYVKTWYDQSGSGRDATQTTTASQAQLILSYVNSKPTLQFDGDDGYVMTNYLTSFTAGSHLTAVKINNDPAVSEVASGLYKYGSVATSTHYPYTDGIIYDGFGTTVRKSVGNPTPSLASWQIYSILSSAAEWTARLCGALVYTTATNTVGWTTAPFLGFGGTVFLTGHIAEHIILSTAISTTDHNTIGADMAARYGLSWTTVT